MAWTTPLTAVANATLPAASWNASVRDNLLATAVALATTSGSHFAATGTNALAERKSQSNTVATSQTTTSTSYTDLATVGPTLTITTGTLAISFTTVQMSNSTTAIDTFASVDISSATTDAAADARALVCDATANHAARRTAAALHTLTAGSNVFTIKYKVAANTGTFVNRNLIVMPF